MLCFAVVTYVSAFLLSDCYRSPHPVTGTRNHSYMDAVRVNLGQKQTWFCGLVQYVSLYGTSIAYTITTSTSMRAIKKSDCYHKEGDKAPCAYGDSFYMLMFGGVQIVLSQIPDFHNMAWLSVMAAIMSFSYSFIGFSLGIAKVIANGSIKGGIGGIPLASSVRKTWRVSQALGDIAFAYPYSIILLEIQVFSQQVFSFVDRWSSEKFPNNGSVKTFYTIKLPFLPAYRFNLLRICFRTIYVASTTGLAMFFPYFNEVLGLLGAFNFWPLAIYFPVEMYFVQRKIETWTKKWIILQTFSVACLLVSIFAFIGSVEGVVSEKLS
ncbi:probable amino acid permease 7 isoform X1 [Typha angustifolia]|uniref:probable amino acid permease 7 isoform X1 n=1 Tax=Typha angustifolia TaxID=59011 RepID=UPI003C2DF9E0